MKKLIFKVNACLSYDDIRRLEESIKDSLDEYGFAIVDSTMEVYEINTGEDDNKWAT